MPKVTVIELDGAQRAALEQGYQHGPAFRRRCQMILLKSRGRISSEVAGIVGVCEMSVHNWVHRYQDHGLAGLETSPGRGRKAILQEQALESARGVVAAHRQRLSVAKAELEQALGEFQPGNIGPLCQKNGGRYKCLRKRLRREPIPEVYELKVEGLKMLETMSEQGWIDLYYADESRVSLQPGGVRKLV